LEVHILRKNITMDQEDVRFLNPSWLKWTARHHWFQQGWTGALNFKGKSVQGRPGAEKKAPNFSVSHPRGVATPEPWDYLALSNRILKEDISDNKVFQWTTNCVSMDFNIK
jgi:hypothetical protein